MVLLRNPRIQDTGGISPGGVAREKTGELGSGVSLRDLKTMIQSLELHARRH